MNQKLCFPKGSLTFDRLTTKQPTQQFGIEEQKTLTNMEKFNRLIEKFYPHEVKTTALPNTALDAVHTVQADIQNYRQMLKNYGVSDTNDYKITFRHPRWSKIFEANKLHGNIELVANFTNLKAMLGQVRDEFKARKNEVRRFRMRSKTTKIKGLMANITYNVSGGVIHMPELKEGVYLRFMKQQERKIVFTNKFPKEIASNYVGIELEFLAPITKEALGELLYDANLGRYVTLTDDGSIKCTHGANLNNCDKGCYGKEFSHELCIIAKESEYKGVMETVCKVLSEVKANVNKTCGMHVHMDCRSRDAEKVYQNLMSAQKVLLRMNPKSRIEKYAKENVERDFLIAKEKGGDPDGRIDENRYYAINAKAFNKHKTIEVRIHAGTIDFTKITNWIEILICVASCEQRYVKVLNSIKTFCVRFGIPERLHSYIKERIDKFKIVTDQEGNDVKIPEAERGVA